MRCGTVDTQQAGFRELTRGRASDSVLQASRAATLSSGAAIDGGMGPKRLRALAVHAHLTGNSL